MAETIRSKKPNNERAAPVAARHGGQVQSLSRALSILNTLADDEHTGLRLTEVAHRVGLATSTAHRLLTTLEENRYVRFDQSTGLWSVGVQAFVAGNSFVRTRDIVTVAKPFMRQLMEECGETVNLAVENRGEVVYLAQVECHKLMRTITRPGGHVLMHCSGVGKALLATFAEREVEKILKKFGLPRETEKTLDTMPRILTDLGDIRQRGYAIDDEENAVGLRCVAAVIFDEQSEALGGLSLSGPTARMTDDRLLKLGEQVAAMAGRITAELGGRKPS